MRSSVRRGAIAAPVALVLGLGVGACGVLPELPDPVPSDIVPSRAVTFAPQGGEQLSPDGFDAVQRMAVRIRNVGCAGLSTGSGFAIDEHTLITNRHVVADSETLEVSTYDGQDLEVSAASSARLADLAVVRTLDALPSYPELAVGDPRTGDAVSVVGYPEGGELTVTAGEIVGTTTDPLHENLGEVLITDAAVEPGSSGSAALDADGRVIGVVYAKTSDGRSLLVPLSTLQDVLADADAFTALPPCSS
ncbi:serine protease [Isoptericola sp. NEAU-Y5]|uniref:Serine protease n=1 Tax=Isoptericola luteus TaxID=2879484 RepID=A0ABS7ZDW8_9MICO|nr:serine protease [Isoptericola sp. NEAU-Y5]MCA5893113.1 serine protease [Isoptericola sp. NEAU-Y5]